MDDNEFYEKKLAENLDQNGDLSPPWEKFPEYERYTIGWRMGSGETWIATWGLFLDRLDSSFDVRLAYLRRHAKAPYSWATSAYQVLHPDENRDDDDLDDLEEDQAIAEARARKAKKHAHLLELGLVASDVAYGTWLKQQAALTWPWQDAETPEQSARYWTRELWFWSRRVAERRAQADWQAPSLPESWKSCESALLTGEVPPLDLSKGLLSLAQSLVAGKVVPPWKLDLRLDDFEDSFDMTMGYVDAFRLWIMSAFDDGPHVSRFLEEHEAPPEWAEWMRANACSGQDWG